MFLIGFVLFVRRKNIDSFVVTFILMIFFVTVFQISHVFGVSAGTAELSRKIFLFNIVIIPIQIFLTHWFLILIGKNKERKLILSLVYGSGLFLCLIYILFPETYLLESVPKLYFPFYYNPGYLLIISRIWFIVAGTYSFIEFIIVYKNTSDPIIKNRFKYVLYPILYAFLLGQTASLLIFNIPFDPLISSFFGLYTIPLAYAMVQYELLDIKLLAKKAFLYALIIFFIGVVIVGIGILNDYINNIYPIFPKWIGYAFTSIIVGGLGIFVWLRSREVDILKYEFVSIITHKFRTPLTRIRWATESLKVSALDDKQKTDMEHIERANTELVQLTNMISNLNEQTISSEFYNPEKVYMNEVIKKISDSYDHIFKFKKITFNNDILEENLTIYVNPEKFKLAIQTLFDNALAYTPEGGHIEVRLSKENNKAVFSIKDNGIGISNVEISRIFLKFYRASNAKLIDTEGTGIGLFIAKGIIERNGGTINVESMGENKGTMFKVTFTCAR